jgi:methylthioribose-1-phosphate isomerase
MQEQMTRRKAMVKRAQVMQQQIKQERATQVELLWAIEHICQQEQEPSEQEPPLQQHQPQQPQQNTSYQSRQNDIDNKFPLADNL